MRTFLWLLFLCLLGACCGLSTPTPFRFTVLHTSDLHSHIMGRGIDLVQNEHTRGNYAKLLRLVHAMQQLNPSSTLTVDAGDWFSGTLFHALSSSYLYSPSKSFSKPIELSFFQEANYDATIIGNHEFDGGEEGFFTLLNYARESNISIPILNSNSYFSSSDCQTKYQSFFPHNFSIFYESPQLISKRKQLLYPGQYLYPYILKELRDDQNRTLKVGIMGLFGPDAASLTINVRKCLHFKGHKDSVNSHDMKEYALIAKETAQLLKEKYNADIVISLSHSGEEEDVHLIEYLHSLHKSQNLIDIHISSHTHSKYLKFTKQNIIIAQAGANAANLGVLQCEFDFQTKRITLLNKKVPNKRFYFDSLKQYSKNRLFHPRIAIKTTIPSDESFATKQKQWIRMIDQGLLKQYPWKYDTFLGYLPTHFGDKQELAQFLLDGVRQELSIRLAKQKYSCGFNQPMSINETKLNQEIDIYVSARDALRVYTKVLARANQTMVPITLSDAFKIFASGSYVTNANEWNTPINGIVHFYISGKQVYELIMVNKILSWFRPGSALSISSSLTFKVNPWGIPFVNRIYDVRIFGREVKQEKLYHVALPDWLGLFMLKTKILTKGFFDFVVYDRHGRVKQDLKKENTFYTEFSLFADYMQKHFYTVTAVEEYQTIHKNK